jgi:methylated-DNA-[protein]-cysteine S-methyltransferase
MPDRPRFAVAPTVLGSFGVVWAECGIRRTWFHAGPPDRARSQIRRAFPRAVEARPVPPDISEALVGVAALVDGDRRDLGAAVLDMRGVPEFDRRVYELVRSVPPGRTVTYGGVAKALGEEPMRARDVGSALARNPFAPIVPCHRVVAADGKLGGYSAPGGAATKRRLLEIEGADIVAPPSQPGLFDALNPS